MRDYQHTLPDLNVRLLCKRGLFRREWISIHAYEADNHSLVVKTDEVFDPGDIVTLSLRLRIAPEDIVLEQVEAKVVSCQKTCSCFYYSLEFVRTDCYVDGCLLQERLERLAFVLQQKIRRLERIRNIGMSSG